MLGALIRSSSATPSRVRRLWCSAPSAVGETGLYGFPHLKTAKGFQRMVDDAIEKSNGLVNWIAGMPSPTEIIEAMDEISDTVCTVIDSAELCRHTHPDRDFVEEASKASLQLSEYLNYLNSNSTLYNAVLKAENSSDLLSEEAQRVAHHLRIDLEKGGIHLRPEKVERVNQLNIEILRLSREFSENIIMDPGHVDIFPATRVPKKMMHLASQISRAPAFESKRSMGRQSNSDERGVRLATEPNALCSILQLASDAEVRKLAYIAGNSAARANLQVLDKILAARQEFSEIMGCKSYAEFALRDNMALHPDVVLTFLNDMSKMVRWKADEEFEKIFNFKKEKIGYFVDDLNPWDEPYFTRMMRSYAHDLDYSIVASYFSLSQCIDGLRMVVESLFGLKFREIPLVPGESWHLDVLKFSLHHTDEGDIGYLYLDLKSRKSKHPICAHFAIKGGRKVSETSYQLPIVALVCNFSCSNTGFVQLQHSDVETLFHEFGHALHSLLSRTDYQHFSGTRVALDFAETPSNLFEYYAWDYRVLRKFAKHYSTGDPIPEKLVNSLQEAKSMFAATDLQRQILYALIDMTLHASQPSSFKDTVSVVSDLQREHTSSKFVEGTHWHTRFSHLVTYGAGYYSYLYAKCFASSIWQKIFKADPLSPSAGSALRCKFLQHGGAKAPSTILNDLGEGFVVRKHNGGMIPDIASLTEEMKLLNVNSLDSER